MAAPRCSRATAVGGERPDWPPLLDQLLKDKRCFQCKTELHVGTIVGLGAQLILDRKTIYAGPVTFLILRCPRCQLVQTRVAIVPQQVVEEAMSQLHDWGRRLTRRQQQEMKDAIECAGDETEPMLEPPDGMFDEDAPLHRPPVRPSRRRFQPQHAFTEAEVETFLFKLAGPSFRVG